ncbi:CBS domain-containing protein [Halocatena halophila]|uniref:CBS domain-containing protein n=1 Tax=Halocatena halophila TaxID=2814576 RepID=UPI002ECFFE9E
MTIRQIAHDAVSAAADESMIDAARTMDTEDIGALVIEESGTVEGIVTDREIALAVAEHEGDLSDVTIEDVMTEGTHTLKEDVESIKAARTMAEAGVRRIPVVDDSDSLVGIVSLDDVVALTGEQLGDAATVIEKQSPGYDRNTGLKRNRSLSCTHVQMIVGRDDVGRC